MSRTRVVGWSAFQLPWERRWREKAEREADEIMRFAHTPESAAYRPRNIAGDWAAQECLTCGALVIYDAEAMDRHSGWHAPPVTDTEAGRDA